ncbi:MAG: DUF3237 domain-containing protein [Acidimicrobiales bacterium]
MSLELVPLGTFTINLKKPMMVPDGAMGTRLIVELDSGTIVGDRLNGEIHGTAGADWLTLGPGGSNGTLDVRLTIKADNGALIYMEYGGKIDLASSTVIATPTFQCGDADYAWLNNVQAIAEGHMADNVLVYELFEVTVV